MGEKIKVGTVSEVKLGTSRVVETASEPIALYNVEGRIYATSNICIHAGGPVGEGSLSGRDITCPWHGWTYDVTTGGCRTNPYGKIKTYPVEIRDNDIYVEI